MIEIITGGIELSMGSSISEILIQIIWNSFSENIVEGEKLGLPFLFTNMNTIRLQLKHEELLDSSQKTFYHKINSWSGFPQELNKFTFSQIMKTLLKRYLWSSGTFLKS